MVFSELSVGYIVGIVLTVLFVGAIGVYSYFLIKNHKQEVKEAEKVREDYKKIKAERKKK